MCKDTYWDIMSSLQLSELQQNTILFSGWSKDILKSLLWADIFINDDLQFIYNMLKFSFMSLFGKLH